MKKAERFEDLQVWERAHKSADIGYIKNNRELIAMSEEVGRMLYGLIRSIQ